MLEEPQLNGRIASVINKLTNSAGWRAREELKGALRGPDTKPDVLITRAYGPPVVIETEYPPATTLADDCMKSIGRELDPAVANASGRVSTVIAIRATDELHQCATGDDAQQMLEDGHEIEYAAYQGTDKRHARFPQGGFIKGNVRDLVDFIRPAAEPQDTINFATQAFEQGVEDAAMLILGCASYTNIGEAIGSTLRQQWPSHPNETPSKQIDLQQEKADQDAREQTAKMTATMMINALAYQQNLAGYSAEVEVNGQKETRIIKSLGQIRKLTGFHPDDVIAEWDNILSINYWPIFHIAKRLLAIIPPTAATHLLDNMAKTANAIQDAIKQNDVAGTVFQRLIADRQTLATYYTRPESTTLAAYLAIPDDLDWADPETLKNYRIADYACGSGGLVLAAYQRARNLHLNHGGNPDSVHAHMMENSLTACDIMPAAVHLTSSLLSSVAPREHYRGTRNVLYPFGGTGETDNKGNPIVDIGSLELLNLKAARRQQAVLPLNQQMVLGATQERRAIEVEMVPRSQSLVIMNPPFTTPTNHAADHAKPGNPAYAAFNTTLAEQKAMSKKVKRLANDTISDGNAGLGTQFAAIAHNMVKSGGQIALILHLSAMLGGSDSPSAKSWQKLRGLLAKEYGDVVVVSIAQNKDVDSSFSADTGMAEVIIIARRLASRERRRSLVHFVNLAERPATKLAAQETAKAIRRAIARLTQPGDHSEIEIGNEKVGTIRLEKVSPAEKWTTVRVANMELVQVATELAQGKLRLPQSKDAVPIPMTPMGSIGRVGPLHRDIASGPQEPDRGPFTKSAGANSGTEWPFLWNRDSKSQQGMEVSPDSHGIIKSGEDEEAGEIWQRASNLHISNELRFNSSSTSAAFTQQVSMGGSSWPNFLMKSPEMEKAACVWLNGTLGLISFWTNSNRTQSGRGRTTVRAIPTIPMLDISKLSKKQVRSAVQIYDDLCHKSLLPTNEAWRDPVRQELDRRLLTEVLDLNDSAVEQLAILRNQWCREPTVTGAKNTGPDS
ncbi:MAG: hypothetical protein J4G01_07295 [Dehalococcoidia bacterium]|nr:hypothetical protein [Dehalococcoidia bacterium]